MCIQHNGLALPVSSRLAEAIRPLLDSYNQSNETTAILNFRDPRYSAETGGYHPVEIMLEKWGSEWKFCYITDFRYVGAGLDAELVKDLDFNFQAGVFQDITGHYPIETAQMIYPIWEDNFLTFWTQMSVYEVEQS
jgi:hypothetical protein